MSSEEGGNVYLSCCRINWTHLGRLGAQIQSCKGNHPALQPKLRCDVFGGRRRYAINVYLSCCRINWTHLDELRSRVSKEITQRLRSDVLQEEGICRVNVYLSCCRIDWTHLGRAQIPSFKGNGPALRPESGCDVFGGSRVQGQ
jgi:hypothetical protein